MPKLTLALTAMSLLLVGCGAPHLQTIHRAEKALTGAPAERLAACIGEPARLDGNGDGEHQVLTFSSAQPRGLDGRTLAEPEAALASRACVFRFTVEDGTVVAVRSENRAGWGFGSITRCSALVAACTGG
ncbi:MAG: hypothetical protein EA356_12960 [Geminicoccaceae bacterium]|nr:MAG: hypothetical protein EA356_12960 [Geminicoccaceae bacterium]